MKGIILAGGKGSRLHPLTNVINKHLLPVYNQPMIYYPIQTLVKMGCKELMIVTGGENPGDFMRLIGDGKKLGLDSVYYSYQENPTGGIADALKIAKNFISKDEKFCVILGDNLILDDCYKEVKKFIDQPNGTARVFIKNIPNPSSFGVAEIDKDKVIDIIEKPTHPKTDLAVVGLYLYDYSVFDIISQTKPSERGELEITSVNNVYASRNNLYYSLLSDSWIDTGSISSLFEAQQTIQNLLKAI
jgi:glucose-1-phosphate thymidylyltransferase